MFESIVCLFDLGFGLVGCLVPHMPLNLIDNIIPASISTSKWDKGLSSRVPMLLKGVFYKPSGKYINSCTKFLFYELESYKYYRQFGCGNLKMVGPKKQDFCNVVTRFQGFHLIF